MERRGHACVGNERHNGTIALLIDRICMLSIMRPV